MLLSKNRYAEVGWLDLMKGEVITISNFDLALTAATLAVVLVVLGLFNKELLLVSFDRAMAITLRKNVVFWDVLLYLLIGLTVSMAVLSVGPLIAFGFLLIPRADGAPVRPQHAPVHRVRLAAGRRRRHLSVSGSPTNGICPSARLMWCCWDAVRRGVDRPSSHPSFQNRKECICLIQPINPCWNFAICAKVSVKWMAVKLK